MVSLPLRSDATAKGVMNKINKHAGTAAAVCAGIIDEELVTFALRLRTEMHMPLAPATGLFLYSAGFSMMDPRAGFAAMDEDAYLHSAVGWIHQTQYTI